MKILLAEDNETTANHLRNGFVQSGFVVDLVDDGADVLYHATNCDYDLIVLDIMLPQQDGWSVLARLRNAGNQTPVLVATACDAVSDRIRGLELGADDYLVKPFTFSELLARARSVLRRGPGRQPEALCIADLTIDLKQHKVARGEKRIDLTAKQFVLLSLLVRHAGEVLPRMMIAEQVWDMNFQSDTNVIDVAIRRLRRKVDNPFDRKLIHSVRGMGYVLEAR